ncbi:Uncharacterised protein [uncultured Clostridium sp.]|nr:Uncharacterised protein [uncultured Clostridium sp.]
MGLILLAMFAAYIICNVMAMKNAPALEEEEEPEESASFAKELGLLAVGAVLIAVGANLLVDNGTLIAQALGVPAVFPPRWHPSPSRRTPCSSATMHRWCWSSRSCSP